MKRWMICLLLLLNSCTIFKEKRRLKTDSLSYVNRTEQLGLMGQWHRSAYQFKDSNSSQAVLIRADAPFKWQADSGLTARAGNYQLYLVQGATSLTAKEASARQHLAATSRLEGKEVQKSVREAKTVSPVWLKAGLFSLLVLLLVLALAVAKNGYGSGFNSSRLPSAISDAPDVDGGGRFLRRKGRGLKRSDK